MKIRASKAFFLALLMFFGAGRGLGQGTLNQEVSPSVLVVAPAVAQSAPPTTSEVVREIDDPHTGNRWLLTRDPSRPGGPGLMVLAAVGFQRANVLGADDSSASKDQSRYLPVIHTGDHLVVEENTSVASVYLDGTALGPAMVGSPLNVRLTIGDSIVRAAALGPHRAVFARETGPRP